MSFFLNFQPPKNLSVNADYLLGSFPLKSDVYATWMVTPSISPQTVK